MSRLLSNMISATVLGSGAFLWMSNGLRLIADPDLWTPSNRFGINGSPYGEVLAMAMQDPIETLWDRSMEGQHVRSKKKVEEARGNIEIQKQVHVADSGIMNQFQYFLNDLTLASNARTNSRPASKAHEFYVRRKIEDKLAFAYSLDPANYGNYNSYHFFLTEPALGTRPELTPGAAKLAEETIQYCLRDSHDPRPALTAASAASNILELIFNDHRNGGARFTVYQMKGYADLLDRCIAVHFEIRRQWEASGNWTRLSSLRVSEYEERIKFVLKMRDTARETIRRIEQNNKTPLVSG